jgi:hypothetical protein
MHMTWKTRTAIAAAAALSSIGLAAGAAQAGTDASAQLSGAKGYFGAYGEHLVATDTLSDGHCARVQLTRRSDGALLGTSTACGVNSDNRSNLSLPEGMSIRITVCVVEGQTPVGLCATGLGIT